MEWRQPLCTLYGIGLKGNCVRRRVAAIQCSFAYVVVIFEWRHLLGEGRRSVVAVRCYG